jgi:hypothetical protein
MGQTQNSIDDKLREFIASQHMFFVATAPLAADGLINLSPKGLDTFVVIDERTVAYLDLTGSGIETVAHARENGRIVVMFCAFDGPPKIIRLHGKAEAIEPSQPGFEPLVSLFPARPGVRSVIRVAVSRISTSCGFGVPLMDFRGDRTILDDSSTRRGEDGLKIYRETKNRMSLDGLPGLAC